MGSQYDAGREIVVVSKVGERLTLTVTRSDSKSGLMGSAGGVEFQLAKPHTVRYKRDVGLMSTTLTLYVDGKQVLRKEISNPFERVEFPFETEGIDCEFIVNFFAVAYEVKVHVGGHEIFYV